MYPATATLTLRADSNHTTEKLAAEILIAENLAAENIVHPMPDEPREAACPLDPWTETASFFEQILHWYRQCLLDEAAGQQFFARRKLVHPELLEHFEIGYADRALHARIPAHKSKLGQALRDRLQELGLYRESGHALYSGSITVPMRSLAGDICDIYGRKVTKNLVPGTILHPYLPKEKRPRGTERGIFNGKSLGLTETLVLADSPLNAMAFFTAHVKHVSCALHGEGVTDELLAALETTYVKRVLLAFRNTELGVAAAEAAAAVLRSAGCQVAHLGLPPGCDANDTLTKLGPEKLAARVLATHSFSPATGVARSRDIEIVSSSDFAPASADKQEAAEDARPLPSNSESTSAPSSLLTITVDSSDIQLTYDDRHYRVRGLHENHSLQRLKVNLKVSRDGLFHVNILDLYSAAQRRGFMRDASAELFVSDDLIKRDLGRMLETLERLQEELVRQRTTISAIEKPVEITEADREAALELLRDENLTRRVIADFTTLGLVGEEANKLIGYLACVSRKMPRPLALLVQSSSGAGKTALMDAALRLMPPEDQVRYSALTGQSLYYMGGAGASGQRLKHKILAVAEEQGVAEASYALKLLQSDGRLKIASAGKDESTGRHTTQDYEVEGPVMMFLTTTSNQPDPELQNRCLTLRVNESPEQTAMIHARQRAAYTVEGHEARGAREQTEKLHQTAQRLLEPYPVVIPWAGSLTFRRDQTRMRRDHEKYLTLIAALTLLHQYERERLVDAEGNLRLVATRTDVELAGKLFADVVGQSLDAILPQTRQLLALIDHYVTERVRESLKTGTRLARSQVRLKQRELRERFSWSDFQLREHLSRLVELEFVLAYRTGEPSCLGLVDLRSLS